MKGEYEFYINGKKIYSNKNTLTNTGRRMIGKMLYSDLKISNLIISNIPLTDLTQGVLPTEGYESYEISNQYVVIENNQNRLTINFEVFLVNSSMSSINLIGLTAFDGDVEYLITASNPNSFSINGLNNVYVSYKLTLDI